MKARNTFRRIKSRTMKPIFSAANEISLQSKHHFLRLVLPPGGTHIGSRLPFRIEPAGAETLSIRPPPNLGACPRPLERRTAAAPGCTCGRPGRSPPGGGGAEVATPGCCGEEPGVATSVCESSMMALRTQGSWVRLMVFLIRHTPTKHSLITAIKSH